MIERERKFTTPARQAKEAIGTLPAIEIQQRYLSQPTSKSEVRIRRAAHGGNGKETEYFTTLKQGFGIERLEIETPLTEQAWHKLGTHACAILRKNRYYLDPSNGISIDCLTDEKDLYVIEAEQQQDGIDIDQFRPDDYRIISTTEVTNNTAMRSRNLAKETEPAHKEIEFTPVQKVVQNIKRLLGTSTQPIIVTVSGPSASGKSSAALDQLTEQLPNICDVVSTDDYYIGKTRMHKEMPPEEKGNFDHPSAIDIEPLVKTIQTLRSGYQVESPIYDMKISEPTTETKIINPRPVIIIEGLAANQTKLRTLSDVSVSVYAPIENRLERRLSRDAIRKGHSSEDILSYYMNVAEPAYIEHYQNDDLSSVDYIINNS